MGEQKGSMGRGTFLLKELNEKSLKNGNSTTCGYVFVIPMKR